MANEKHQRKSADRRQEELGPPHGWKDRRHATERRIPEIVECEVSESEWLLYFGSTKTTTTTTTPDGTTTTTVVQVEVEVEAASDIFGRIRD
jgi:hypothetical protein